MENNPGRFRFLREPKIIPARERSNRRILGPRMRLASAAILVLAGAAIFGVARDGNQVIPAMQEFSDPDGEFANFNSAGPTDTETNAFFQDLGTNGRRCVSCHQASDAWSVTPPHIRDRFNATRGIDPIF